MCNQLRPGPLRDALEAACRDVERRMIADALTRVGWRRVKAAPLLGLSYKSLLLKIRVYGLRPETAEAPPPAGCPVRGWFNDAEFSCVVGPQPHRVHLGRLADGQLVELEVRP